MALLFLARCGVGEGAAFSQRQTLIAGAGFEPATSGYGLSDRFAFGSTGIVALGLA